MKNMNVEGGAICNMCGQEFNELLGRGRDFWNQKLIDAFTYAIEHPSPEAIRDGDYVLQEQRKNIKSVEFHEDGITLDIPKSSD